MQVTHQEISGHILAQYEFKGSELEQRLHFFFPLSFHLININASFPWTTIILSRCLQLKNIKSFLFYLTRKAQTRSLRGMLTEKKDNVGQGWQNIIQGEEAKIRLLNQTISMSEYNLKLSKKTGITNLIFCYFTLSVKCFFQAKKRLSHFFRFFYSCFFL